MSVVGASGMSNPNPACYHCLPTTLGERTITQGSLRSRVLNRVKQYDGVQDDGEFASCLLKASHSHVQRSSYEDMQHIPGD